MVGKCRDLLHIVSLQVNIEDQWFLGFEFGGWVFRSRCLPFSH